jgi:hypothetical protein
MTTTPILRTRQGSASKSHLSLFERSLVPFYLSSKMCPSSPAHTIQISNLILSRKNKMTAIYLNMTLMLVQSIRVARGVGLTLVPQWPVAVTAIVVGTPSPSYWSIHSLVDIDHLAHTSTFRLLRLLPNRLKTSKYGHVSIPVSSTADVDVDSAGTGGVGARGGGGPRSPSPSLIIRVTRRVISEKNLIRIIVRISGKASLTMQPYALRRGGY